MKGPVRPRRRVGWSLLACSAAVLGIIALSGCAVGGEQCSLSGVANFTPGLRTAQQAVSYTFSGSLTGCHSTLGDATIKSASISASGSGSKVGCTGGNTSGTATISWNNGQSSTISFTTSGALNAVTVFGTVTGGEFVGHSVKAVLAFTVSDPTLCTKSPGVTSATFAGETTPV